MAGDLQLWLIAQRVLGLDLARLCIVISRQSVCLVGFVCARIC
jgi:hypothetical protein